MSIIHESLYQTNDFSKINFSEYVVSLSKNLVHSYSSLDKFIDLTHQIEDVSLNKIKWKKTIFKDTIKYDDMPWEKEAYKLETKLAIECFKECL